MYTLLLVRISWLPRILIQKVRWNAPKETAAKWEKTGVVVSLTEAASMDAKA